MYITPTGKIYIPIWTIKDSAHMRAPARRSGFTFQYGRLKTRRDCQHGVCNKFLYIPIWTIKDRHRRLRRQYMFRLYIPIWTIKDENLRHRTQGILILYIPIWTIKDRLRGSAAPSAFWFTFQYGRLKTGDIYRLAGKSELRLHSNMDD